MSTYEEIRVLLIEDSDVDAKRVDTLLRYSGYAIYNVVRAHTLAEGISMATSLAVHVALVDLGLPDTDGLEAVGALTQKFPDLPLIVLTGQDDFDSGISSIRAGAQDYIVKAEFGSHVLERAIIHACERKAAQLRIQKFYRETMRTVVTDDVAEIAELTTQHKQLMDAVEAAQPQLKTLAPNVHQQLQAVMGVSTQTRTPSASGLVPLRNTQTLVRDISRITQEVSSVADVSEDPRSVLADVLDRYPGHHGSTR